MSLTELPFGLPGRVFRSPMPFGPYDLHGEVYDQFCEEQITVKRASRCCICPFLILGFQPEMTWNRQSNTRLPMLKLDTIL
jgi:hypothetical protein